MERRSNFTEAVAILAELTGMTVFTMMRDDGIPRPITVGIHRIAFKEGAPGKKRAISRALWKLGYSKRYLAACQAEGAMRHDATGYPQAPVTVSQQEWARQRLQMREQQSERAAERRREKEVA